MPRKLIVEIIGDSTKLVRSFNQSTVAANKFGAEVTGTAGKAEKSLTRLQRVAAGGFIGAAALSGGIVALRRVVDAASESQQVLGQTQVALESTGKSWAQYGEQIEDAIKAQSRLGFDDEALLRTFSLFVRQSRDVGEAIRRNAIAMNVARARFIDLEQAANLVNKAALGQAGALRRVGIDARNGASGVELLAQLERQFAGAAEDASNKAVGATDRLKVSMENIEETIGSALLPIVTELATTLSDVADGANLAAEKLRALGNITIPAINIPINFSIPGTDTKIGGALKEFALQTNPLIGPIRRLRQTIDLFKDEAAPDTRAAAEAFDASVDSFVEGIERGVDKAVDKGNRRIKAFGDKGFKPIETNELGEKLRAQFEATLEALDLQFDRAQLAGNAEQSLALLDQIEAAIRQRIATQGRTTDLLRQLFEVESQRVRIIQQGKDESRRAAQEARDLAQEQAKAAREMQKALEQQRQFRAIGLSPEGGDIVPTVDNLRKQFEQLSKNVVREDVSNKLLARLKSVGKALAGGIKNMTPETRAAIRDLFQAIRSEFDKGAKETGPKTATQSLNASKVLEGLGLGRDMEKELRARLSSFNTAGLALAGATRPTGGFGSGPISTRPIVVESHTTVQLDNDVVGRNITRTQQKNRRRNPSQKRGPNSGV